MQIAFIIIGAHEPTCSAFTTSMMTPPLSILASPALVVQVDCSGASEVPDVDMAREKDNELSNDVSNSKTGVAPKRI